MSSSRPTISPRRITRTVQGRTRSIGLSRRLRMPRFPTRMARQVCNSTSTSATSMAPAASSRSSDLPARSGPTETSAGATKSSRRGTKSSTPSSRQRGPASSSPTSKPATTISTGRLVFRYAIFGHQTNARAAANDCTTGAIDPENRQFLVTLGGVDAASQPCFGTEAGFSIGSSLSSPGRSCTTSVTR